MTRHPTTDDLGIRLYCAEQRIPLDSLTEWPADVPLPMRLLEVGIKKGSFRKGLPPSAST